MALPVVKNKYKHLKAMETMDSLESYIAVNENEAANDISSSKLNKLRYIIHTFLYDKTK